MKEKEETWVFVQGLYKVKSLQCLQFLLVSLRFKLPFLQSWNKDDKYEIGFLEEKFQFLYSLLAFRYSGADNLKRH